MFTGSVWVIQRYARRKVHTCVHTPGRYDNILRIYRQLIMVWAPLFAQCPLDPPELFNDMDGGNTLTLIPPGWRMIKYTSCLESHCSHDVYWIHLSRTSMWTEEISKYSSYFPECIWHNVCKGLPPPLLPRCPLDPPEPCKDVDRGNTI